jgi:hypothetical protein
MHTGRRYNKAIQQSAVEPAFGEVNCAKSAWADQQSAVSHKTN